jgi:cytochrome c oxidase subunit III
MGRNLARRDGQGQSETIMPGKSVLDDIELIIEDVRRGGGGKPPDRDGGDDGESYRRREPSGHPLQRRYFTALIVAVVAILMFFMALASAYIVRRASSGDWIAIRIPPIVWVNTAVLLASSATLELARRKLAKGDAGAFRNFWALTTALGIAFLAGQFMAWRQLAAQGVFIATNPASSFFYVFTGTHAAHLFGGVALLLYVVARKFEKARISRAAAAQVASYYWHFMDALWVFLLTLIYVGK